MSVLVKYCVYFGLKSQTITADEITQLIGVIPTEAKVKGSRDPERVIPRAHHWLLDSESPKWGPNQEGIGCYELEARTAELAEKLAPATAAIKSLVKGGEVAAALHAVRTFSKGELAVSSIGIGMSAELVEFLAAVGASLDIDEYDETYGDDETPDIPWIEGPNGTKFQRLL